MTKMDPKLVAAKQKHEVRYLARKWKITAASARQIIEKYGPSRKACNEALANLKASNDL